MPDEDVNDHESPQEVRPARLDALGRSAHRPVDRLGPRAGLDACFAACEFVTWSNRIAIPDGQNRCQTATTDSFISSPTSGEGPSRLPAEDRPRQSPVASSTPMSPRSFVRQRPAGLPRSRRARSPG